jgi:hypothetical protein
MPYSAEISRANPSCLLFLIDQSSSMGDPIGGGDGQGKAQGVADAVNRLLQTLVLRCAKSEGVRDYYHVGVIGYGQTVGSLLPAPPQRVAAVGPASPLVPVSYVANNPARVEDRERLVSDGAGGLVAQRFKFPVWFDPVAYGPTPMCEALDLAWDVVNDFLGRYPHCYPPLVVNITDGESTDGDPDANAVSVRDLASADGNVLLYNLHVSSLSEQPTVFPSDEAGLPDEYARLLFRMSSLLPPAMRANAQREGFRVTERSRGFAFNADLVSVIRFLDIGTRMDPKNFR